MPSPRRAKVLFEVGCEANDKLTDLYYRLLARIVHIAERVEKALGFDPMPPCPDVEADPAVEPESVS